LAGYWHLLQRSVKCDKSSEQNEPRKEDGAGHSSHASFLNGFAALLARPTSLKFKNMSTKIVDIKRIEETVLWKKLESQNDTKAKPLIAQLTHLCEEASDRMKAMPTTSPQYTLHDESHFLRVTELMAMVLGESIDQLNSIELCLLILSAYYHDQGMVMDETEFAQLSTDVKFQIFRDTWYMEHPNQKDISIQLQNSNITGTEQSRLASLLAEMEAAMLTDYLRTTHAKRSATYIIERFSADQRLEISGINLADVLAKICESHYSHTNELVPANGYNYDEQIGLYKINLSFIAIILRLADILDFDADRTPEVLLRTIHFSSSISLQEWRKHRGIRGWEINTNLIRFSANYSHPAYQAAAFKFMDWVDKELSECQNLCRSFPAQFQHYKLPLPPIVDRSRIKPLNDSYICHDLEISLSRDEIVKLLMTDRLYNKPYVCIRELLQNSLDALRYRKSLFAYSDMEWSKGRVDFLHTVDKNGYEIIQCKDNGSGMDRDIVTRFFTKAGRSFYRSPEFERERANFKKKNIDYDPCSQFGIGFMSCFMLGDRIKVETRRDYGLGKASGEPLVIEINGLGGLIVIKKGPANMEVGTTVTITSRKKPSFLDTWSDNVVLTAALKHFAVATEFPITGKCEVEDLEDYVEIPTTPSFVPTLIEGAGINRALYITIALNFKELDENLGGIIRESFLIDDTGIPCLATQDISWEAERDGSSKSFVIMQNGQKKSEARIVKTYEGSQISIDGILLCGAASRPDMRFGHRATHIFGSPHSLDVRGILKPEITPAREPAEHHGFIFRPPKWRALSHIVAQASGKIWAELLNDFFPKGFDSETFWKLLVVYGADARDISLDYMWHHLSIPLIKEETNWVKLSSITRLAFQRSYEGWHLETLDNQKVSLPLDLSEWEKSGNDHPNMTDQINSVIVALSTLRIENGRIIFDLSAPHDEQATASSLRIYTAGHSLSAIPYLGKIKDVITAQSPIRTANRSHSLTSPFKML